MCASAGASCTKCWRTGWTCEWLFLRLGSLTSRFLLFRRRRYGYNGTACIHRAICETLESSLHPYNGVVGDVTHIVFRLVASAQSQASNIYNFLHVLVHLRRKTRIFLFRTTKRKLTDVLRIARDIGNIVRLGYLT